MRADLRRTVVFEGDRTRVAGRTFPTRSVLLLGLSVLFPLLVVIAYVSTRGVLSGFSMLTVAVSQQSSLNVQLQSFDSSPLSHLTGQNFLPTGSSPLGGVFLVGLPGLDYLAVLVVVAAATMVVVVMRGLGRRRSRTAPFDVDEVGLEEGRERLAAILDAAAAKLSGGSSYRQTVIWCYRTTSELLEERSDVDGRMLTAREFEERISEKLKVDSPYLGELTGLFEVARYSDREVTEEQSREAVACLSNLSALLKTPAIAVRGKQRRRGTT